ncbi:MAG: sodium-dependent transporter [Gemmatimonadota bacterium]|nr:sodium-dependent transporter [Gemmatimonadota bacterium]MDE3006108.1 sodium-dependent transporter [Gemmatimonadota bacterium]MDE3013343.1 sodium-dependent transporter [Gemmatimonadota bacterium]
MVKPRETFGSKFAVLATMVGLAVGLGNVWRFPYMVGQFGGATFILLYLGIAGLVAVPALMGEWAIGRHTRLGSLGAFEAVGMPGGRGLGWILVAISWAAVSYYTNAIGWVAFHGLAQAATSMGAAFDASVILPPETGFSPHSTALQFGFTAAILALQATVILKGVRQGIERISTIVTPVLFFTLLILIVRAVTLEGAGAGIAWLLDFDLQAVTPTAAVAALGQVVFSVGLGGTLMVVYGSYLSSDVDVRSTAALTVIGDTGAGLLAGLAIFPAVFALGLEPAGGPGLLFATLPQVFTRIPLGWLFGSLFFGGLFGAALLSGIAAYEVLVASFSDVLGWSRKRAVWVVYGVSLVLAIPPMINLGIFVPWDLTFGSGGQTFGALVSVVTVGWVMDRGALLHQLAGDSPSRWDQLLIHWLRWFVPIAVSVAAAWWLLTDVLGIVGGT